MQSKDTQDSAAHGRRYAAGFVHRLLQRMKPFSVEAQAGESAFGDLQPAGRRSGEGAASLAPYLDQFRSTKPTALE